MGHKGTERALFEHNLANAKAAAKAATPNKPDKVMSTKLNPEEIAAMKKSVDRSRAYGLMRGCVDGLLMCLPKDERPRIERLMRDADELWEPIAIDEQSDPISHIKSLIEP